MKVNVQWFTIIELLTGITITLIISVIASSFLTSYYRTTKDIDNYNTNEVNIESAFSAIQKIIFEKWYYFKYPESVLNYQCSNFNNKDECLTPIIVVMTNQNNIEYDSYIGLNKCHNGFWKQIYYTFNWKKISLSKCIIWEVKIKVEFVDDELKEKIVRFYIEVDNNTFKKTLYAK